MSRNSLEKIIIRFDLYPEARQNVPIEDVIEMMRKNITIVPTRRGDTFSVTFQGKQDKVMKVTNSLAAMFIEENLKYREERATEVSRYTQDELNLAQAVLDRKEQAMRDYKLKHFNEMPEQRQGNLGRLNALHARYQGRQDSIQDLERTRIMIHEQISLLNRINDALVSDRVTVTPNRAMGKYERLQKLRQYLDGLSAKYTEKHPEVRRTKQLIANLESDLEQTSPATETGSVRRVQNPEIQRLQLQIKEIGLNIRKLRQDQVNIKEEISRHEKWIEAVPVREAAWKSLTRDYGELRRHYDFLVSQNLQALSVKHLERKQKGSKFEIVDPARFPEKPFKPDFKKMLLLALGIGGGLGVGLTLVMDFLNTSFRDPDKLESALGVGVICSVPYVKTAKENYRQRIATVLYVCLFGGYTLILVAALVYLYWQGKIII